MVELNAALNLRPDKDSKDETEQEKAAIKRSVLDYIGKRKECLNLAQVTKMLSLDKAEMDQQSIARDLELRAKNRTIAKLKRQGEQYRNFNKEIHYMMEPQLYKDQIVTHLRQKQRTSAGLPISASTTNNAQKTA